MVKSWLLRHQKEKQLQKQFNILFGNKHSESIAKAIQVPYRPQQIFKRYNSYISRSKGPKSNFKSINRNTTEKSFGNVRKTNFLQRALTPVTVGQAWRNSNLICFESKAIHIQNFNWKSQKTAEKNPENKLWGKGNNYCKNRPSVTKLKLDLYYVVSNSYTRFQVNISKDAVVSNSYTRF